MARARLLAFLLASALSGCMVLDLAGDLEASPCGSDGDCAHLEASHASGTCSDWRCLEDARCHLAMVDADGDGSPPSLCTGDDADDCDDQDATVRPGAVEVSNDRDDDCDGIVDEVVIEDATETVRYSSLGLLAPSKASRGPSNEDGCLTFVERGETGTGGARLLEIDDGTPVTGIVRTLRGSEVDLVVRSVDAERVASDTLAIAAVPDGECERVVVALANESTTAPARAVAKFVDNSGTHFERGVPDANGDDCRATTVVHAARAPIVVTEGSDGVVLWLAASSALDACAVVSDVPVLAHRFGVSGDSTSVGNGAASVLGATDDASPPGAIAVPDYGIVIAFVDDGSLVLSRVTMGSGDALTATVLLRSPMVDSVTLASPVLTLGPVEDGSPTVGVMLRAGTCELGHPVFVRVLLAGTPTDASPTRVLGTGITRLGAGGDGSPHDRSHALVYADAPRGFWAFWIDTGALYARHVRDDGVVLGTAPRMFQSPRIAAFQSLAALGPVPGETPSITLIVGATSTAGANVLVERRFTFP